MIGSRPITENKCLHHYETVTPLPFKFCITRGNPGYPLMGKGPKVMIEAVAGILWQYEVKESKLLTKAR